MASARQIFTKEWTRNQAALLLAVCLAAGIAGGWAIRGACFAKAADSVAPNTGARAEAAPSAQPAASAPPNSAQRRAMADQQSAPLIEKLKSDPRNADILVSIGNLYYDAQQYSVAVDYYGRALAIRPGEVSVRTDRGTALWYLGNADGAIAEFNQALALAPSNPNTLFNRGLVFWKGKHDSAAAIADWQKLLATTPNYDQKNQVEKMIAEARGQTAAKP